MRSGDRPGLQIGNKTVTRLQSTTCKDEKGSKSVKYGMDGHESAMRVQWGLNCYCYGCAALAPRKDTPFRYCHFLSFPVRVRVWSYCETCFRGLVGNSALFPAGEMSEGPRSSTDRALDSKPGYASSILAGVTRCSSTVVWLNGRNRLTLP